MDEIETTPIAREKHLLAREPDAPGSDQNVEKGSTRSAGGGIGLRVHGIYIVVISVAVLIVLITLIAIASGMM